MDDLRDLKHFYEQEGYNEIRTALQEDFIADPQRFMEHFGCRPEDLTGAQLREYYPHFLVSDRQVRSKHEGFKKRFLNGTLFGQVISLPNMPNMAVSSYPELSIA